MDGSHFDALTRTVTAPLSRRVTLRGLAAGVLLACGLGLDEAGGLAMMGGMGMGMMGGMGMGGAKPCSFGRTRCGDECCILGETCLNNRCFHHCRDLEVNGGESDLNCGSACVGFLGAAGRCDLRKRCAVDDDCKSGKCREPQPGQGLQCAECLIDTDCTSPIFRRCLDHFCFECALDADCPSPFGSPSEDLCVVINACPRNQPCVCRQCRQDSDCPPQRPHCNTGTDDIAGKLCNECLEDAHCTDPARPRCANRHCVECRQDTEQIDCPAGQLCNEQSNICEDLCPGRTRRGRVQAEGDNCPDPCSNGVQDSNETDVDCGGPDCPKCAVGLQCLTDRDCQSGFCDEDVCVEAPECSEDEDCPEDHECNLGQCEPRFRCESDDDCESEFGDSRLRCCEGDCFFRFDSRHCGECGNACPGECACCFNGFCAGRAEGGFCVCP